MERVGRTGDELHGTGAFTTMQALFLGATVVTLESRLGGLARYKRPRHMVVVPAIVRGPNGKADYRWARETAVESVAVQRN